jgi:hypothetical protein
MYNVNTVDATSTQTPPNATYRSVVIRRPRMACCRMQNNKCNDRIQCHVQLVNCVYARVHNYRDRPSPVREVAARRRHALVNRRRRAAAHRQRAAAHRQRALANRRPHATERAMHQGRFGQSCCASHVCRLQTAQQLC